MIAWVLWGATMESSYEPSPRRVTLSLDGDVFVATLEECGDRRRGIGDTAEEAVKNALIDDLPPAAMIALAAAAIRS